MSSRQTGSVQKHLTAPGGMLNRYKQTVIGDQRWIVLVLYELYELFIQPIGGPIGSWLRTVILPFFLNNLGCSSRIDTNVTMRRPGRIQLGSSVTLARDVTFNVKDNGQGIYLANHVKVDRETIFSCIGGELKIGKGTRIGRQCRLGSKQGLDIGESCLIGDCTYIVGASHAKDRTDIPIIDQKITCEGPSSIGDHVTIGENVTILDGIQIGSHVHIAPGSLVNHNIDSNMHVAGTPAHIVKKST